MTPTASKRLVLAALAGTAVIAVVKAAQQDQRPRAGIFIGATVAGVILTGLADPAPDLAAGLAGLTLLGTAAASPQTLAAATGALSVRRQTNRGSLRATPSPVPAVTPAATAASVTTGTGSRPRNDPNNPPALVNIGQPGHRLAPDAAAAFRLAEQRFGRTIWVTDSYRSYAVQAAGHAADPNRFGSPDTSRHVSGEAIDVHTGKIRPDDPQLVNALTSAGWCHTKRPDEPWHWSYNGCG